MSEESREDVGDDVPTTEDPTQADNTVAVDGTRPDLERAVSRLETVEDILEDELEAGPEPSRCPKVTTLQLLGWARDDIEAGCRDRADEDLVDEDMRDDFISLAEAMFSWGAEYDTIAASLRAAADELYADQVIEGLVVSDSPLVIDNGEDTRTIDDVDEDHGLELGEAVRVEPDGVRRIDYDPIKRAGANR